MQTLDMLAELSLKARKDVLDPKLRARVLEELGRAEATWRTPLPEGRELALSHPANMSFLEKAELLRGRKGASAADFIRVARFGRAAWFDAAGMLGPYLWFVRCFFAGAIAFLALTPQYLPAILSIVFVIPIYLGLRGLKKRTRDGLNLAMSVFPMTLLASLMAVRGYLAALGDWDAYVLAQSASYGVAPAWASAMSIAFFVLALVGVAAALLGTWLGLRHRELYA